MIVTMSNKRAVAIALIVSLSYTPVLGSFSVSSAAAQSTQNTTYNYQYDNMGNRSQITDSLGNVSNIGYDQLQRVKQQIQPVPATGIARPTTSYTYDGLDQLSTVVDPRNLTTAYTHDGLGNQPALSSPDTGSTSRVFDNAGNLLTSTDARGKVTTFTYDALNRVTSVAYASGTSTLLEYDGGASGAPYAIGHLTKMTDESGQTIYTYDVIGRLLTKTQVTTGNGASNVSRQVGYAYDNTGQLLSLTYPSGNRINYEYDAAGRVRRLVLNPATPNGGTDVSVSAVMLDQISYAPFGSAQSWVWGNSTEAAPNAYARTFDLDGRVFTYPLGNVNVLSQNILRTIAYDAASRITAYTHTGSSNAAIYDQGFSYDGLGRLISYVNATGTQGYAYDASGNRTRLSIGANAFPASIATASNRLSATSGPAPAKTNQFDSAGNLISDGTTSFTYSDRGRLQSATKSGTTTTYRYNGLGQRLSKEGSSVASGRNEYVYDEAGHLLGEYDANASVLQETVWLGEIPVGVLKTVTTGAPDSATPAVYYVYADHLNTPRVVADSISNTIVWSWIDADPFGMVQPNESPYGSASFNYNPRFPGQLFDRETSLHYNYYRDYDPQLGRYVQSDPIGLDGGINTYSYVESNPLTLVDPMGQNAILAVARAGRFGWEIGEAINPYIQPAISTALEMLLGDPIAAAQGNVADTQIVSDYGKDASASKLCGKKPDDPCDWLKKNAGKYSPDRVKRTEKAWGCRGSRHGKGGKDKQA